MFAPFGQMKPLEKTSSASPRTFVTESPSSVISRPQVASQSGQVLVFDSLPGCHRHGSKHTPDTPSLQRPARVRPILASAMARQSERRGAAGWSSAATCPTQPGVYLFRDGRGEVIYVGKAKSIRKRVASHFSSPVPARATPRWWRWSTRSSRRGRQLRGRGAAGRAELHQAAPSALQHPPARRQVLPVHRDLARRGLPARLLHARAPPPRPRVLRPVLQRQARARDARRARQGLHVPLLPGAEPGRRSGSPCLDYYIKRCEAPCVGYVDGGVLSQADRRGDRLPLRALRGDRGATWRADGRAAAEQEYEHAARASATG